MSHVIGEEIMLKYISDLLFSSNDDQPKGQELELPMFEPEILCIHDQIIKEQLEVKPCFAAPEAEYIAPQVELIPVSETNTQE